MRHYAVHSYKELDIRVRRFKFGLRLRHQRNCIHIQLPFAQAHGAAKVWGRVSVAHADVGGQRLAPAKGSGDPATLFTMRTGLLSMTLFAVRLVSASEREDRADIERVIKSLGDAQTPLAQKKELFTIDAQNEFDRLSDLDRRMAPGWEAPWSEVTGPRMVVESIRFITGDVALVDAANTQYGSPLGLAARAPVLLVMKKEPQGWRITALRALARR